MAQQSTRRGWKNQVESVCCKHDVLMWIRSANSHSGQQYKHCIKKAGQMAASDYVQTHFTACVCRGVHR